MKLHFVGNKFFYGMAYSTGKKGKNRHFPTCSKVLSVMCTVCVCKEVLVSKFAWDFHEFLSPVMFEMFSIVVKSSTHSITNSSKTNFETLAL